MRRGSLADLDFHRFPVPTVAVFALWPVLHEVSEAEAITRLRATAVGAEAMRRAAAVLTDGRPDGHRRDSARRLLLAAAQDPPPPLQATIA